MYRVSIIIPVFNGMPYLKKCLESVLNQTIENYEVIVVNDGSTDGSKEYVEEIASKSKNIKVINQQNQGLYNARKRGLEAANGKYIGWVDADDFVDLNMFKKMYNTAILNDSDFVYCDYNFYPHKIKTKEKWFRPFNGVKDIDYIERNNQPWNKLVKKELLDKLQISQMFPKCFDESYIKVLLNAKKPMSINDKLYFYRVGGTSISSSYTNVEHYKKFVDASIELKQEMNGESLYWDSYFEYRIIYYYLMAILVAANANRKQDYLELRDLLRSTTEYKNNMFIKHILNKNFGMLKSFVITNFITANYGFARIIAQIAL